MEVAGLKDNFYEWNKQNGLSLAKGRTNFLVDLNFYHDSMGKYVFLSLEGIVLLTENRSDLYTQSISPFSHGH